MPKSVNAMSAKAALLIAVAAATLMSSRAQAQWWGTSGPVDFEECADSAEKAATKEAQTAAMAECNAKFAGRRKPGGGYSYFDFMQNRSFDIAGPNPTPQEQKYIDEQYTAFLEQERRNSIAAAFAAKQQQLQQTSLKAEKVSAPVPMPARAPNKPPSAASDPKARINDENCSRHSFSCEWPRLSEGIKDLKKLFSPTPSKPKRG